MSNNIINKELWIVGAGPMAIDHVKVALHLGITPIVIGRGKESAKKFEEEVGIPVHTGGLKAFLSKNKPSSNTFIVIATGTEVLMPNLLEFVDLNFAAILVEKPAAISISELLENEQKLLSIQNKVFVAYNRRFYSSVRKALELIDEDGGLQTMHFEFTEWSHKIEPLSKSPGVKENWFFANSTHIVDLAFFIAGLPNDWKAYSKKGTLNWHEKSFFTGSGITEKGVLFSYNSNWESAGRWGVELMTPLRKIILRPIEGVRVVKRGTINEEILDLDPNAEGGFKPGLLNQLETFLSQNVGNSLSLKMHISNSKTFLKQMIN